MESAEHEWIASGPEGFLDIDVAADGTSVAIGPSGSLLRWNAENREWTPIGGGWPSLTQISIGSADDLWGLDSEGQAHHSAGAGGATLVASALQCVSAGADGTVWGVAAGGDVLSYDADGGAWQKVPAPAPMRRVSVGSADRIVAVDESGGVHTYQAQDEWASEGGSFSAISTSRDGVTCAVTVDGQVSVDLGNAGGWYALRGSMRAVAVGSPTNIWGLDADGRAIDLTGGRGLFAEHGHVHDPHRVGWDAQDPYDDTKSTHLWIVNQAARLAALDLNPGGRQIYELVKPGQGKVGDPFHDQLCQGLYDADWLDQYRGPKIAGLQPSYAGHFYDPDTGLNWLGSKYNTAVTNNRDYGSVAFEKFSKLDDLGHPRVLPVSDRGPAGYNLGLALHYLTDLTQPMHSSNFTQVSSHPNFMYHGAVETYAMEHQSKTTPPTYESPAAGPHGQACPLRPTDSCGLTACSDLERYCRAAARHSKDLYAEKLIDVAGKSYYGWDQDPAYWTNVVDPLVSPMLRDAILFTAQYLVAWLEVVKRGIDYNDGYDSRWQRTQGYLTNVAAGSDGSVWGVGRQYPVDADNIFRWTGSAWDGIKGRLTSIAVGSKDSVWGVNAQRATGQENVYRWLGAGWRRQPMELTSIAATSDGVVWGVNARQPSTENNIYRWAGTSWAPVVGHLTSIAAAANGQVWGVNTHPERLTTMSNVFRWNGTSWDLVGDKFLTGISVADDGSVWGVDALQFARSNNVFAWDGNSWHERAGFLTQIANGGAAQVWGVNADHIYGNEPLPNIYRWQPS